MTSTDRYEVDIESVKTLIRAWGSGSDELGAISKKLSNIHDQLTGCIPHALSDGLASDVALQGSLAKVADAASIAGRVAAGLAQDTASLDANLAAYVATEASVEAKLKSIKKHHGGSTPPHGSIPTLGSTHKPHQPGGSTTPSPGSAQYANQAQVESWIDQAFQALEASGVPASELDKAGVLLIIEHESSGNPNAINNWDSNAQAGDPSRGLMQVIGTTFGEYKLPGHDDIYNPVDNIVAGVRYALSRYGSIQNVPGVKSVDNGGSYVGY
jgi:hypothetical protein